MHSSDGGPFDRLESPEQHRARASGAQWSTQNQRCVDETARMRNSEKLRRAVWYAMDSSELSTEVQRALQEVFKPTNLAIFAGVLAAWAGSHFIGVGEVADIVMAGMLYMSLGEQGVRGLIELAEFAREVIGASCDLQLRRAATRLTRGIALLGVDAALAVLLRGARVVSRPVRNRARPGLSRDVPKQPTRAAENSNVATEAPRPSTQPGTRPVWEHIKPTDAPIPGTSIPKSFELATSEGRFWVHPNATKHMGEYLTRNGLSHGTSISSQAMLQSLQSAVEAAARQGVQSRRMMQVGRWELMFNQRKDDVLPVLMHALYR